MPKESKTKSDGRRIDRLHFAQIHIAKSQLVMDDADYRSLLMRVAGVSTSRDLDIKSFNAVMEAFARLGFLSTSTRERRLEQNRAPGHATYAQRALIQRLWRTYTGRDDNKGLARWIKRFGVQHIRFMSTEQAQKIIGALKNFHMPDNAPAIAKGD